MGSCTECRQGLLLVRIDGARFSFLHDTSTSTWEIGHIGPVILTFTFIDALELEILS